LKANTPQQGNFSGVKLKKKWEEINIFIMIVYIVCIC